ncbi:MAG TPA: DUF2652 domain-containing protein [Gaiellaceae bacterium]|nr:DUF2652 domain-containing protein [Gaiellaceae bacterium]
MTPARSTRRERGCLLVADISGYTAYVVSSPLAEAEDVLADVTATVSESLGVVFRLNKLEGDAVFGYTLEDGLDATMVLDAVEECYFAFRRRLRGLEHATACSCNACARIPDLDLKFAVHAGEWVRRAGRGGEELTGRDVIVVHRLLKNSVADAFGLAGYALFTEACVNRLGLDPDALDLHPHVEEYGDVGPVRAFVSDLEGRWTQEAERRRVVVPPADACFEVEAVLPAPQAVAWEHLTAPGKRGRWTQSVLDERTTGGRRGAGTEYCVDDRALVYEEILDWRPFDYFTERRTLVGSASLVLTTELEPVPGGTKVTTRGARDGGRIAWLRSGPRFVRRLEGGYRRLAEALAADEAA